MTAFTDEAELEHSLDLQPIMFSSEWNPLPAQPGQRGTVQASWLRECWGPVLVPSPQFTQLPREEKQKEEGSRERMSQVFLPHFSCLRTCFFSIEIQKVLYCLQWTLKCSILDTVFILIHMLGVGLVNLNGNTYFSIAKGTQISPLGSYKLKVVENASWASSSQLQNPWPH